MSVRKFISSLCFFGSFALMAQQSIQYPYNPDVDNDEYIATSDLTGFLAQFGQDFQPAPVLIDSVDLLSVIQMMQAQITALQAQVATLESSSVPGLATYVSIDDSAHTVLVSGANLQVVNGLGTDLGQNGLGNIIGGYNTPAAESELLERTGSHNIIVGQGQRYTGNCNLIGGQDNLASGTWGIVLGTQNDLGGIRNVMIGGSNNQANGAVNVVIGGAQNFTDGNWNVVLGGQSNVNEGTYSVVMGGKQNSALATWNTVVGGQENSIGLVTDNCLVLGGNGNSISDYSTHSAILGGQNNHVGNPVAGSSYSAIVGGVSNNIVRGTHTAIFGGEVNSIGAVDQETDVRYSVISGGRYNELISGYANGIYGGEQNKHLIASEDGSISETARTTYGGLGNQNKAGFGTAILGGQSLQALIRDTYNPGVATVDVLIGSAQRTFIGSTSSQGGQVVQTAFGTGE